MSNNYDNFGEVFETKKPIIGMIHLRALPGAPSYNGEGLDTIIEHAINEGTSLINGGVDGLMVENFGDVSYTINETIPEMIVAMSIVTWEIRKKFQNVPMGICLLNDPISAIAIAHATNAQFVRVPYFTEAAMSMCGFANGDPHRILRYRKSLNPNIKLITDVHVKHGAPLVTRPIEDSVHDVADLMSSAAIISGAHTGFPASVEEVKRVKKFMPDFTVLIGSGVNKDNVEELFKYADGAITGTALKVDGVSTNNVDPKRVKDFMEIVKNLRNC